MAAEAERTPERVSERESGGISKQMADPWGVKRAENLLTSLQGVLSARVVVSPIGEVTEVHVLTQPGTHPKQVVRNVESALLAQLGLKVDHRRISVAQTAEVKPIEALERHAVREQALRRSIVFVGVSARAVRPGRVEIEVTLSAGGDDVTGRLEVADTARTRVQGAARATVLALVGLVPDATIELEGAKVIRAFDEEFVFAGAYVVEGRKSAQLLPGTCRLEDNPERAAVLAVLDATNRWLTGRYGT
jgi:hypothetical protein